VFYQKRKFVVILINFSSTAKNQNQNNSQINERKSFSKNLLEKTNLSKPNNNASIGNKNYKNNKNESNIQTKSSSSSNVQNGNKSYQIFQDRASILKKFYEPLFKPNEFENQRTKPLFAYQLKAKNAESPQKYFDPKKDQEKQIDEEKSKYNYLSGLNILELALKSNYRKNIELYLDEAYQKYLPLEILKLIELAKSKEVIITYTTEVEIDKLTKYKGHKGIILKSESRDLYYLKHFKGFQNKLMKKQNGNLVLITEYIDASSFATLIHTSVYLGVDFIMANMIHKDNLNTMVSVSSKGASELSEIYTLINMKDFIKGKLI
jgi:tRNA G18 (ribose-2'-O)-methylase SpoU